MRTLEIIALVVGALWLGFKIGWLYAGRDQEKGS